MKSQEALQKAIDMADRGDSVHPEFVDGRARLAQTWLNIAQYLKKEEDG